MIGSAQSSPVFSSYWANNLVMRRSGSLGHLIPPRNLQGSANSESGGSRSPVIDFARRLTGRSKARNEEKKVAQARGNLDQKTQSNDYQLSFSSNDSNSTSSARAGSDKNNNNWTVMSPNGSRFRILLSHQKRALSLNTSNPWTWLSASNSSTRSAPVSAHSLSPGFTRGSGEKTKTKFLSKSIPLEWIERLHHILPKYGEYLSHPTWENASKACALFLQEQDPKIQQDSEQNCPNHATGSPSNWSKHRRKNRGAIKESNNKSSIDQESSSWQLWVSPFFLLAFSQALHADMEIMSGVHNERRGHLPPANISNTDKDKSDSRNNANGDANEDQFDDDDDQEETNPCNLYWVQMFQRLIKLDFAPMLSKLKKQKQKQQQQRIVSSTQNRKGNVDDDCSLSCLITTLEGIIALLKMQKRFIIFQHRHSLDKLTWLQTFCKEILIPPPNNIYNRNKSTSSWGACYPMIQTLQSQVQLACGLLEVAFWLERGRFLETIVHSKKVQQRLDKIMEGRDHANITTLQLWYCTIFEDFLSILPLIFDRVRTFAGSLHGFDHQVLANECNNNSTLRRQQRQQRMTDFDAMVLEFLRRQEKAGGNTTAVTIVLFPHKILADNNTSLRQAPIEKATRRGSAVNNAQQKSPLQRPSRQQNRSQPKEKYKQDKEKKESLGRRIELGFSFSSVNGDDESTSGNNISNNSNEWVPIYMRTTKYLSGASAGNAVVTSGGLGLINGIRPPSQTSLSIRSTESTPNIRSMIRTSIDSNFYNNVFEYEIASEYNLPASGKPPPRRPWPYSEWSQLERFLEHANSNRQPIGAATSVTTDVNSSKAGAAMPTMTDEMRVSKKTAKASPSHTVSCSSQNNANESIFLQNASASKHGIIVENKHHKSSPNKESKRDISKLNPINLLAAIVPNNASTEQRGPLGSLDPMQTVSMGVPDTQTVFHAIPLSDFMSMAILVKGEEESRWHRRRSRGLDDSEIQTFLNVMGSKLCVSPRFKVDDLIVSQLRAKVKDRIAPRVRSTIIAAARRNRRNIVFSHYVQNWNDINQVQDFVRDLKDVFGISEQSRFRSIIGMERSPHKQGGRGGNSLVQFDYRESAAAFFLGPELCHMLIDR